MTDTSSTAQADPLSTSPNALPLPGVTPASAGASGTTSTTEAPTEAPRTGTVVYSSADRGRGGEDALSQVLQRIEDKTARIEEKYARSEALLLRMGDRVDAASGVITNEAARQADLMALRNEVAALSQRTRGLPGAGTLFVMAILTAILTAAAIAAVLTYGVPGWIPPR